MGKKKAIEKFFDKLCGGAIVVVGSYERAVGIHSLSFSHWSDKLDSFAYCCALVLASAAVVGTESLTSVQGYQV